MLKGIFTSRKFWAALAAVATAIGTAYGGEITWTQAIQSIVAIVAAYIVGTGISTAKKAG